MTIHLGSSRPHRAAASLLAALTIPAALAIAALAIFAVLPALHATVEVARGAPHRGAATITSVGVTTRGSCTARVATQAELLASHTARYDELATNPDAQGYYQIEYDHGLLSYWVTELPRDTPVQVTPVLRLNLNYGGRVLMRQLVGGSWIAESSLEVPENCQ